MSTGPVHVSSSPVSWRLVLIWASVLMGLLEFVSAFIIEFPVAAIVAVIVFLAGAYRLSRGTSKLAVVALGIFHLVELVFGVFFLGKPADETGGLALLIPVLVVSAAGLLAAAMTMREGSRQEDGLET